MKYSIEALREANIVIDNHRAEALNLFYENKKRAYDALPELSEIDAELSSVGMAISAKVISDKANIKKNIEEIKIKNQELINKKKDLLLSAGFPEDFLSIPYHCKKCNDSGYVDAMPCDCLKEVLSEITKRENEKKSLESSICFENFKLDFYPEEINGIPCKQIMRDTLDACKEYAEEFSLSSPNLLMFGGTGVGKTHISLAILKVVAKKGYNVLYLSSPDLFSSLEKERFSQLTPAQSIDEINSCDLLIIDDLGAEFTTSFTTSALYNIINTRILLERPTIITANLAPSELPARYSERIASRILGCYEHLRFIGNDIRILKKKS